MIDQFTVIRSEVDADTVQIDPFVFIGENVKLGKRVRIHSHVTIDEGAVIGDDVEIFPGAYIGKPPKGPALGSHTTYQKELSIGNGCVIGPNVTVYYGVHIGERTLLGDGVSIRENVEIGNLCIIGRNSVVNYGAKIEDEVKVMELAEITARTVIRKRAFVSTGVVTADDNRFGKATAENATPVGGQEIGENANVGLGALLLPNVKIGKNAVVGAGSVVTRDVEDGALVMGIPARERK